VSDSRFLTKLVVELVAPYDNDGAGNWALREPLQFYSHRLDKVLTVGPDFDTDFASVPRVPLIYANYGNKYHRSATLHDSLCRTKVVPRDVADKLFLDAMQSEIAERIEELRNRGESEDDIHEFEASEMGRAQTMYAAVRLYSVTMAS
jgi:hypothetical protein